MASIIQIKRSGTQLQPTSLKIGELAYSYADSSQKLFIGVGNVDSFGTADDIAVIGGAFYTGLLTVENGVSSPNRVLVLGDSRDVDYLYIKTLLSDSAVIQNIVSEYGEILVIRSEEITVNYLQADSADFTLLRAEEGIVKQFASDSAYIKYASIDSADISQLSADSSYLKYLKSDSADIDVLRTNRIETKYIGADSAFISQLSGDSAYIKYLLADSAFISQLSADSAYTKYLKADSAFISQLSADSTYTKYLQADSAFISQLSADSAYAKYLQADSAFISQLSIDSAYAKYLQADSAFISQLSADSAYIKYLLADSAFISQLSADSAYVKYLKADSAFISQLSADSAYVKYLKADSAFISQLSADSAYSKYLKADSAFISQLSGDSAYFKYLKADSAFISQLSADSAYAKYLQADSAFISQLSGDSAYIKYLLADSAFISQLSGDSAYFKYLQADIARVEYLEVDSAFISQLSGDSAYFKYLQADDAYISRLDVDSFKTGRLYTGFIDGPETIYIDPSALGDNTGRVVILGDLIIEGETTTVNSTTVTINDKNLVLADSAVDSAFADGAGITIGGANATFTYRFSGDRFVTNKDLAVPTIYADSGEITNLISTNLSVTNLSVTNLSVDSAKITNISGTDLNYQSGYFQSLTAENFAIDGLRPYTVVIVDSKGEIASEEDLGFNETQFSVGIDRFTVNRNTGSTYIFSDLNVESDLTASTLTLKSVSTGAILVADNGNMMDETDNLRFGSRPSEYGTFNGLNVGLERIFDSGYYRFSVNQNTGAVAAQSMKIGAYPERPLGQFTQTYPNEGVLDFYGLEIGDKVLTSTAQLNKFQVDISRADARGLDSFSEEANIIQVKSILDSTIFEVKKDGSINFTGALLKDGLPFEAGGVFKKSTYEDVYYDAPRVTSNFSDPQSILLYNAQRGGRLGLNTTTPKHQLEISDGELFISGPLNTGSTYPEALNLGYSYPNATSKFLFFPQKAATRGGYWDNSQFSAFTFGNYSTAFGRNVNALGISSVAMGDSASAIDEYTIAIGKNVTTGTNNDRTAVIGVDNTVLANSGNYIVVIGSNNTNGGDETHVFGRNNTITATADRAYVFGLDNTISGLQSTIIGASNNVSASNSRVFGRDNTITSFAPGSTVIGNDNLADATQAIVIGSNSKVYGQNSIAIGPDITVKGDFSIGISITGGQQKQTVDSDNVLAILGGGVLINPTADSYQVGSNSLVVVGDILYTGQIRQSVLGGGTVSGNIFVDDGTDVTYTEGKNLGIHVETPRDRVQIAGSFSIRDEFPNVTYIPDDPTNADILDSTAGDQNQFVFHPASGAIRAGLLEFLSNDSIGILSVGMGYNPVAGNYAVSLGYNNKADGAHSVAIGKDNTVPGQFNYVIGKDNQINDGTDLYLFGNGNTVSGQDNIAIGTNITISTNDTVVVGRSVNTTGNTANAIILNPENATYNVDSAVNQVVIPGINTNVAIGKTIAAYKLDVGGDINLNGNLYINDQLAGIFEYDSPSKSYVVPRGLIIDVIPADGRINLTIDSVGVTVYDSLGVLGNAGIVGNLRVDGSLQTQGEGIFGGNLSLDSGANFTLKEGSLTLNKGNLSIVGDLNVDSGNTYIQDLFIKGISFDSYLVAALTGGLQDLLGEDPVQSAPGNIDTISKTSPIVVTTFNVHGLGQNWTVEFDSVGGMTTLNNGSYFVDIINTLSFELWDDSTGNESRNPIDGRLLDEYVPGTGTFIGTPYVAPGQTTTAPVSLFDGLIDLIDTDYVQARVALENFWAYNPSVGPALSFNFDPDPLSRVPVGIHTRNPGINYALDVNGNVNVGGEFYIGGVEFNAWFAENGGATISQIVDANYINQLVQVNESTIVNFIDSNYVTNIVTDEYILARSKDSSFWQRTADTLFFGTYPNVYNVKVGIGTDNPVTKFQVAGKGTFDSGLDVSGNLFVKEFDITTDSTYQYTFTTDDLSVTRSAIFDSNDIETAYFTQVLNESDTSFLLNLEFNDPYVRYLSVYTINAQGDSQDLTPGESAGQLGATADYVITGPQDNFIQVATSAVDSSNLFLYFIERKIPSDLLVLSDSDNSGNILDYNTAYVQVILSDSLGQQKAILSSTDIIKVNNNTLIVNDSSYLTIGDRITINDRSPKILSENELWGKLDQYGNTIIHDGNLTLTNGNVVVNGKIISTDSAIFENGISTNKIYVSDSFTIDGTSRFNNDLYVDSSAIFYYGPSALTGESDGVGNPIYKRLSFDSNIERIVDSNYIGNRLQDVWNFNNDEFGNQQIYYDKGGAIVIGRPEDMYPGDSNTKFLSARGNAIFAHDSIDLDIETLTEDIVPNFGPGARMMWIPQRGAFRAGYVSDQGNGETVFDDNKIGLYSVGIGYNAEAGHYSTAMGYSVSAGSRGTNGGTVSVSYGLNITNRGTNGVSIGKDLFAEDAENGLSIGKNITNLNDNNVAIGDTVTVTQNGAENVGIGKNVTVTGSSNGVGIGRNITAGRGSVVIGDTNSADLGGVSVGRDNTASYGVSVGINTVSSRSGSVSVGVGSRATNNSSTAVGDVSQADGASSTAVGRNSRASHSGTSVGVNTLAGQSAVALGVSTTATGSSAVSLGRSNTAGGGSGVAIGIGNTASTGSIAIGSSNNSTLSAIVIGRSNYGSSAVVLGSGNNVSTSSSVAVGYSNTGGQGIVSIGKSNIANNYGAVFGVGNQSNTYTFVYGKNNRSNYQGGVFGDNNVSNRDTSFVYGFNNTSNYNASLIFGRNNTSNNQSYIYGRYNTSQTRVNIFGNFNDNTVTSTSDYGYIFGNKSSVTNYGFTFGSRNTITDGGFIYGSQSTVSVGGYSFGETNTVSYGGFAFGKSNVIDGEAGTPYAFGLENSVSDNGIAFGKNNTVSGNAIALGSNTSATGTGSLALGNNILVSGNNSVGIGLAAVNTGDSVGRNNTLAILGGQVGIGLNDPYPLYQVEVDGAVNTRNGDFYHRGKRLFNYILDDVANHNWIRSNADSDYIHSATGFEYLRTSLIPQYFFHNDLQNLYYIGGGNVGIKTANPQYDLHVGGDINFDGKLYLGGVEVIPSKDSINDVAISVIYNQSFYYIDSATTVEDFIDSAYVQARQSYFDYENIINGEYINSRVDFSFLPDSYYIEDQINLFAQQVTFKTDAIGFAKYKNIGPAAAFLGTRVGIGYDSDVFLQKGAGLDIMDGGVFIENGNLELTNGNIYIDGELFEPNSPFIDDGTFVVYNPINGPLLNVGIGKFTPRFALDVAGDINIDEGYNFKINDQNLLHEILDSAYINSKLDRSLFLDSAEASFLIDSNYIKDIADSSYVKAFIDSDHILSIADSAYVLTIVDSAYITRIIDSDYILSIADSAYVTSIIDSNYVKGFIDSNYVKGIADSDYILSIADSAYVTSIIDSNYVKGIADSDYILSIADSDYVKTAADSDWIKFVADEFYVKGIANISYVQGIANEEYVKGFIDSPYISTLTGIGAKDIDFGNHRILYSNDFATIANMPNPGVYEGMFAYNKGLKTPVVSDNGVWATLARENRDVVFNRITTTDGLIVGGDLQVNGTLTTINTQSLEVSDNMIYLNAAESGGSPTQFIDIGFAANYNETGTYAHAGFFRDATDGIWKVYDGYLPEPDASLQINTSDPSFTLAPLQVKEIIVDKISRISNAPLGTYGSASLIPVIKLDSSGFIDSIGEISVAGVDSVSYNDVNGEFTIFTADGNSFSDTITLDPFTTDDLAEGINLYFTTARTDSAFDVRLATKTTDDLAEGINLYYTEDRVITLIDSAYVQARIVPQGVDSAAVTALIDSAYVNARVSTIDSAQILAIVDSAHVTSIIDINYVTGFIDSAYVNARVSTIDSAQVLAIVDSAYITSVIDSSYVTNLIDSAYINERVSTIDSAQILAIVDSAHVTSIIDINYVTGFIDSAYVNERIGITAEVSLLANQLRYQTYYFAPALGQSILSGLDQNGNELSYSVGTVQVFLNGINLLNGVDYTAVDGNTIVLTTQATGNEDIFISTLKITGEVGFGFREYLFTADSGQLEFFGADDNGLQLQYTVGNLIAHLNGIKLQAGLDYTATDGNKIVLSEAALLEDELTITTAFVENSQLDSAENEFGDITVNGITNNTGRYTNLVNGIEADSAGVVIIDTIEHNSLFTSIEYLVHMQDSANGHSQISKVLVTYNKTNVFSTEYGVVNSYQNDSDMGTLSVDAPGEVIRLKFEKSTGTGNVTIKPVKTIIQ